MEGYGFWIENFNVGNTKFYILHEDKMACESNLKDYALYQRTLLRNNTHQAPAGKPVEVDQ